MIYNRHYVLTVANRRLNAQYIHTLFVVHALCNVLRSGFWLLLFFWMWPQRWRRCCFSCSLYSTCACARIILSVNIYNGHRIVRWWRSEKGNAKPKILSRRKIYRENMKTISLRPFLTSAIVYCVTVGGSTDCSIWPETDEFECGESEE